MFIAFEGIDASGKATHSKLLSERLKAHLVSFPVYTTPMGKLIKSHLMGEWSVASNLTLAGDRDGGETKRMDAMVFQALQLANRAEAYSEMVHLIMQDKHLVADRYTASGLVYGKADGLDPAYLEALHECLPHPDLYLLMDIDPADSAARRPERRDRYEKQAGLMETVSGLYRELWKERAFREPERWIVIDARGSKDQTQEKVWAAVQRRLEDFDT